MLSVIEPVMKQQWKSLKQHKRNHENYINIQKKYKTLMFSP